MIFPDYSLLITAPPNKAKLTTMRNSAPIDRISNLPDEAICHILSFLPTKLAFTTTVLSKRWTSLVKFLTALSFDDESIRHDKDRFLHFRLFVNTVTLSTKLLKTFHIKCVSQHWQRNDRFYVDSLIETVKRHPVENLQIVSWFTDFPLNIFVFPTLVILKLNRLNVFGNISVVDLPTLKTLHLSEVYFKNKDNLNKLLNGCPILQDLHIDHIYYVGIEYYIEAEVKLKSFSKLMRANIDASHDVPFTAIYNVHFLKIKMLEMPFEYRDFFLLQNLVHLEISFSYMHRLDDVVKVLQNCPKLQILSITKYPFVHHPDFNRNWNDPDIVPKCISSHLRSCTLIYHGFKCEIQFAKYILKHAPLLRVMKITFAESSSSQDALKELNSCPRISSECELSISFI